MSPVRSVSFGSLDAPSATYAYMDYVSSTYNPAPMTRSSSLVWGSPNRFTDFSTRARSPYSSTPAYAERYPHLRYRYDYCRDRASDVLAGSVTRGSSAPRHYYSVGRGLPKPSVTLTVKEARADQQRTLDSSLSLYASTLFNQPVYGFMYGKPKLSGPAAPPFSGYSRDPVYDYHYFSIYGRQGTTPKYWHSPSYWRDKRTGESTRSLDLSRKGYKYWQCYGK